MKTLLRSESETNDDEIMDLICNCERVAALTTYPDASKGSRNWLRHINDLHKLREELIFIDLQYDLQDFLPQWAEMH